MADLLLDLAREVSRGWGVEVDPHALDEAAPRGVRRVGGGAVLGLRLAALTPHAKVVRHARLQNAVGYFRYGQRLLGPREVAEKIGR